jgi:lambda family phage minor tail protein L
MSILSELRKSAPSKIIDLFSAELSSISENDTTVLNYFSDTNELGNNIWWAGDEFLAYPFEISGFEWDGAGQLPTPRLRIGNLGGTISEYNRLYDDLLGLKVTRIRTMLKYLDSVNFADGNEDADDTAQFPKEVYFIDRKVSENNSVVEYDLVSALDISSIKLPRRLVIQNTCQWRYRGAECNYTGSAMFTKLGVSTTNSALDVCGKRLSDCKIRFGASSTLNYGAFPGAGLFN